MPRRKTAPALRSICASEAPTGWGDGLLHGRRLGDALLMRGKSSSMRPAFGTASASRSRRPETISRADPGHFALRDEFFSNRRRRRMEPSSKRARSERVSSLRRQARFLQHRQAGQGRPRPSPSRTRRKRVAQNGRIFRPHTALRDGAKGANRTRDTALFRRVLYQLSYLGTRFRRAHRIVALRCARERWRR